MEGMARFSVLVLLGLVFSIAFEPSFALGGDSMSKKGRLMFEVSGGILQIEAPDLGNKELLSLDIATPDDKVIHRETGESVITFEPDGTTIDGYYHFDVEIVDTVSGNVMDRLTGEFRVKNGEIEPVQMGLRESSLGLIKRMGLLLAKALNAVFDGVSKEAYCAYGYYDGLYLSYYQPFIYFDDTDNSGASWGENDWSIKVTGATNTTSGYFYIWNYSAASSYIFLNDAGTDGYHTIYLRSDGDLSLADDRLYIDRSSENVGIGTDSPLYKLDVVTGGYYGLRIRNNTTSSARTLSFRVTDAYSNTIASNGDTLYLNAYPYHIHLNPYGGNVAIGTRDQPTERLTVKGNVKAYFNGSFTAGDGLKKLAQLSSNNTATGKTSDSGFSMINSKQGFSWNFRTYEPSQGFAATKDGTGGTEFELRNTTNSYQNVSLHLGNGAYCSSSGQWIDASSREYKENIRPLDEKRAFEVLESLEPVTFNFKRDASKRESVGFIAEEMPELLSVPGKKGVNALEVVAILTKVVKDQQAIISKQSQLIRMQQKSLSHLKARLEKVEQEIRTKNLLSLNEN